MNMNTTYDLIIEAVAQSATVKAWCQTNYSKDHTVVGYDHKNPPQSSDCPSFSAIYDRKIITAKPGELKLSVFSFFTRIYDDTTTTYPLISNLTDYAGIKNHESFRKLIETVIINLTLDNSLGNAWVDKLDISYNNVEKPYFSAITTITFAEDNLIGRGINTFI